MQILDSGNNITTVVPKMIETPNTHIINAHIYDKPSLKPIPFEYYYNSSNLGTLIYSVFNNCICTLEDYKPGDNYNQVGIFLHHANNNQKLFQDTSNPNVFYTMVRTSRDGKCSMNLLKFEIENNNIKLLNTKAKNDTYSQSSYYNRFQSGHDIQILYQTDEYLIYVYKKPNGFVNTTTGSGRSEGTFQQGKFHAYYIIKYNKNTCEETTIVSYVDRIHNIQFLEYNNGEIYLYDTMRYYNNAVIGTHADNLIRILKVNVGSNTVITIGSIQDNNKINVVDNPVKIDDYYYTIKDNGNRTYCFYKIKLNIENDTIEEEQININYNEYIVDISEATAGDLLEHTLNTIFVNNKKYIICSVHAFPHNKNYPNCHKNIVFELVQITKEIETVEINEETGEEITVIKEITVEEAVVTDIISFKNGCKGVLKYIDANTLIFLFNDGIGFYKFDNTQGKYIECYKKSGIFNVIGLDTLNRFYAQHTNGDIELMTALNACTLRADFTDEYYRQINIDTEIHYFAKNFLDEYLSTDVVISLVGPVQFKDDSSKEKIIRTSGEGVDTLPVTITGSGRIEVVITQYTD